MKRLPIAEWFHSLQGEGLWQLTPMLFIRTAGCNVGAAPEYGSCTTFDGRIFRCDTDYRKKMECTLQEVIALATAPTKTLNGVEAANATPVPVESHICITGGEPFLHDLREVLEIPDKMFHFETSGTLPIPQWVNILRKANDGWIACSPKKGFLPENRPLIDEWKFLVDENFPANDPEAAILDVIGDSKGLVFLQPINERHSVNLENLQHCQRLLRSHPDWRLSIQTHKLIGLP